MISVLGGGAFGTALAVSLARGGQRVTLWARDVTHHARTGEMPRLPGVTLPDAVRVTDDLTQAVAGDVLLMAVPMQRLRAVLSQIADPLEARPVVLCCKGIDLASGLGPSRVLKAAKPDAIGAVLTGPSFARDIACGLPTALTLACAAPETGTRLQERLSTPVLRLYRSEDVTGAELGGALKNVIAIACGASIGAGLGDSARAALMTRGFAEMTRLARQLGARPETLSGLSGMGDLVLTCTSDGSRNYRYGLDLGRGGTPDPTLTVEGVATAQAAARIARQADLSLPIAAATAALTTGDLTVAQAMDHLLARPLKEE